MDRSARIVVLCLGLLLIGLFGLDGWLNFHRERRIQALTEVVCLQADALDRIDGVAVGVQSLLIAQTDEEKAKIIEELRNNPVFVPSNRNAAAPRTTTTRPRATAAATTAPAPAPTAAPVPATSTPTSSTTDRRTPSSVPRPTTTTTVLPTVSIPTIPISLIEQKGCPRP